MKKNALILAEHKEDFGGKLAMDGELRQIRAGMRVLPAGKIPCV